MKKESGLKALKNEIRDKNPGTLYIFHGEEDYLRSHYLSELEKCLVDEGLREFNYHRFEGRGLDMRALSQAVDALPMMAERSLVVVTDFDPFRAAGEAREQLCELLADIPEYCCLVFVFDTVEYKPDRRQKKLCALLEAGSVVDFEAESRSVLIPWIKRRFSALGKDISDENAEHLIFFCGSSMTMLVQEIEKIGAYAKGEQVSREDIEAVGTQLLNAAAFDMSGAVAEGDFTKAAQILRELSDMREEPIKILGALGYQLRRLCFARLAMDCGKGADYLAKALGSRSEYPMRMLMKSAENFSADWCRTALRLCAETDAAMKSTPQDPQELLELLILRLAGEARR